ncbi:hypothetical protein [Leekyejoonella antrihumi]|uniref:hypothetical protein n=1 Tax=Leekyejoonella antrihumi TaxID=1660198 RepID=UPI001644ABD7|nr:hypothetical protein [Leekyejoonella antrihumi]
MQRPHHPVWLVGAMVAGRRSQPSLARAARCQGSFRAVAGGAEGSSGLDLESFGTIVAILRADAGVTWWVESWWDLPEGPDGVAELHRRIDAGPPG